MVKPDKHSFFLFDGMRWHAQGRAIEPSALVAVGSHPMIATAGGRAYAVGRGGAVAVWDEAATQSPAGRQAGGVFRWRLILREEDVEATFEAPIQIVAGAWDDRVHAVSNDGAVFRLDGDAGGSAELRWTKVLAKTTDFGARSWPLWAYDPSRRLLVVWGECKKSKGRKDETFVCDGRSWTKAKKGKEKPEGLDSEDSGHFTLFFEPAAGQVARLSGTQVGLFDGQAWTHTPHTAGSLATAWELTPCAVPGSGAVFLVKRHAGEREIVRLRRAGAGYELSVVAALVAPVERDPHSTGGNASFDIGWFDAATARYLAHFEDDGSLNFSLDLRSLAH